MKPGLLISLALVTCAAIVVGSFLGEMGRLRRNKGPSIPYHPGFYENSFTPAGFEEGDRELRRLHERFGEKYYSWHYEEWFIRDFFNDKRSGFFVDVGAWRYSLSSNTFFLENVLGWTGVAIDAQDEFRPDYERHRPGTKYFTYFVSDMSTGSRELFVADSNTATASGVREHLSNHDLEITKTVDVPEITLNDLLTRVGVAKIDLLTMDIELAEPAALRGFDIQRFAPELVCIEDHPQVREFIEHYFETNGYEKIALWSRIDSHNSYYRRRR
jgi:FkbM family methyltransferase